MHRACNSCDQKRKAKAQRTSMCLSRIAATGKQKKKKEEITRRLVAERTSYRS